MKIKRWFEDEQNKAVTFVFALALVFGLVFGINLTGVLSVQNQQRLEINTTDGGTANLIYEDGKLLGVDVNGNGDVDDTTSEMSLWGSTKISDTHVGTELLSLNDDGEITFGDDQEVSITYDSETKSISFNGADLQDIGSIDAEQVVINDKLNNKELSNRSFSVDFGLNRRYNAAKDTYFGTANAPIIPRQQPTNMGHNRGTAYTIYTAGVSQNTHIFMEDDLGNFELIAELHDDYKSNHIDAQVSVRGELIVFIGSDAEITGETAELHAFSDGNWDRLESGESADWVFTGFNGRPFAFQMLSYFDSYSDNGVLIAEYDSSDAPNDVRIIRKHFNQDFEVTLDFGDLTEETRHFHSLDEDPYTDYIYATTGDTHYTEEGEIMWFKSEDYGQTWSKLEETHSSFDEDGHDALIYKTLRLNFTPDYIYWTTDVGTRRQGLWRASRDDLGNPEQVLDYPEGLIGYGSVHFEYPSGLLLGLLTGGSWNKDYVPLLFYSFEDGYTYELKRLYSSGADTFGLRKLPPYQNSRTGYANVGIANLDDFVGSSSSGLNIRVAKSSSFGYRYDGEWTP